MVLRGDRNATDGAALREVWMMRSDLRGLVSVGFLDRDRRRFTVPAAMDTSRFPVLEVSAEADDGDPSHSGDSIVRGTLARRPAIPSPELSDTTYSAACDSIPACQTVVLSHERVSVTT